MYLMLLLEISPLKEFLLPSMEPLEIKNIYKDLSVLPSLKEELLSLKLENNLVPPQLLMLFVIMFMIGLLELPLEKLFLWQSWEMEVMECLLMFVSVTLLFVKMEIGKLFKDLIFLNSLKEN